MHYAHWTNDHASARAIAKTIVVSLNVSEAELIRAICAEAAAIDPEWTRSLSAAKRRSLEEWLAGTRSPRFNSVFDLAVNADVPVVELLFRNWIAPQPAGVGLRS